MLLQWQSGDASMPDVSHLASWKEEEEEEEEWEGEGE